jgi:hypothetical protein
LSFGPSYMAFSSIERPTSALGNKAISSQSLGSTRVGKWLGWLTTLALVTAVAFALRSADYASVASLVPRSSAFWVVFAASYLTAPLADWIIFRRLWGLELGGIIPLLRKSILNALVVSYAGEAYFYAWARGRITATGGKPFGAIKDVAILSGLVGNAATLLLVIASWPMLKLIHLGGAQTPLAASVAVLATISVGAIVFRAKVFHLNPRELIFVGAVHLARTILTVGLVALLWHLAMPAVGLQLWLLLSTGRMVVSRLPLIANKDLAFAGIAAFVFQHDLAIVELMAMTAMLVFAAHLASALALLANDLKLSHTQTVA